jgi:hypothetical protein
MTASSRLAATVFTIACAAAGTLAAQGKQPEAGEAGEHALTAAQVPAAVKQAFRRAYPTATVRKYSSEVENGHTVYELETMDGTTRRDMIITASGTITEVETTVTPDQLPAPVRSAATARHGVIERAEVVVMGRDTTYEIKVHGRAGELKLRANGQAVPAARP